MLNKFYKISIIFSLLLIFISIPAYAKVVESVVPVTYSVSEHSRYDLKVNVSGDGTVYDGTKRIRNGSVVHQLKVSEEKKFKIIPDRGSHIKQITWKYGDTDLSRYYEIKDLENGKELTLKGISTDSELTIEFEGNNNEHDNSGNNESDNSGTNEDADSPKTGDKGILIWAMLLISSFVMMITFKVVDSKKTYKKK